MSMTGWDRRFMGLAQHIAEWSKDTGRHVGAVIKGPDNEIRATGYNGFPRGIDDDVPERHARATGAKYVWAEHAERNALYNAARVGVSVKDCALYVTLYPCVECARGIIQAGIRELITFPPDYDDPKWGEGFRVAGRMFDEAGIVVRYIKE